MLEFSAGGSSELSALSAGQLNYRITLHIITCTAMITYNEDANQFVKDDVEI